MQQESKTKNQITDVWWFVFLRGGLIFGLLMLLPSSILVDIFLDATNGTWLHDYNPIRAQRIVRWTEPEYVAIKALYYFASGTLLGLFWWICHKYKAREAMSTKASGDEIKEPK